jgi:F420-dependent oxidoreductase-like protein
MRISVLLPYDGRPKDGADRVSDYERAGIDAVWVPEVWGFDSPTLMGYIAARTSRIDICAGIVNVYSRSAALLAQTAAGLDHLSGGRAVLGIGTSGPQVVEGWHGVPFEHPIRRLRETIEVVRTVVRRAPLDRSGSLPEGRGRGLGKPLRLLNVPERAAVPIVVAGLGPAAVRLSAELADGWMPIFYLPEHAPAVWDHALADGTARRSADLGDLAIVAGGVVAIDTDLDAARAAARRTLALYVGGMGARGANFYFDLACRYGFADAAGRVQDRFLAGDAAGAAAEVPDELVAQTNLIGSPADVRGRIDAYRAAGVTELMVAPAGDDPGGQLTRLRALTS